MVTAQYIFIKESPNIQLAHLYEHIFCERIYELLTGRRLYQYIDYDLIAKTYYGGIICVELSFYSDITSDFITGLLHADIFINHETISTGVTQILAEKELPIVMTNIDKVGDALYHLHVKPWISINEVGVIDAKKIRKHPYPLFIADGDPLKAKKLKLKMISKIEFNSIRRELLPLCRQVSQAMMMNFQALVCKKFGTFTEDNKFIVDKNKAQLVQDFKIANGNEDLLDLKKIISECQDMFGEIVENGGMERFRHILSGINYSVLSSQPNLQSNYEDTTIFIGSKGWSDIATQENVNILLGNFIIEAQLGQQKRAADMTYVKATYES